MTYLLGITGSVASGKSTMAAQLKASLAQQHPTLTLEVVCTDAFLYPTEKLKALGLLEKKGFPESYDTQALMQFLSDVKQGKSPLFAPRYNHLSYDIVPDAYTRVEQPDVLIVEGLNVLFAELKDFFDFSVYLHAEENVLETWYIQRFLRLCEEGRYAPDAYFYRYADWAEGELIAQAKRIWREVNLPNLRQNILPTKEKAQLVLNKSVNHTFI